MVVTTLRAGIRDALLIADRFTGKHISLPIIGNVLLKAEGQRLKIQATNLESGIEITLAAKIVKEGMVAVPPRILSSILQTLNDEKISLQEKQSTLFLETTSSKSEIKGIPTKEFPIMPAVKGKPAFIIPNTILDQQLSRVLPTISPSDFKPEISGVLVKAEKSNIVLVGTDTFRLTEAKINKAEILEPFLATIPLHPLQELIRIIDKEDETTFTYNEGQVAIETDAARIISRVVGGRYPDYESLVPKEFSATVRADRDLLLASVRLSGVFASKLNDVILSYRPGRLRIEIVNPEVGKHTREIEARVTGKSGRVAFNHRYLSDALEALRAKEISLFITDEAHPSVVRDEKDQAFFTLLMPIRLS